MAPIYVTPVAFDGRYARITDDGEPTFLAVTRDVTLRGIGFTHDEPLDASHAIVTFDLRNGVRVSLLLDVQWSNFKREYAYLSGGTFIGLTDAPEL